MKYKDMTFQEQCKIAEACSVGDVWVNNKTKRKCTVTTKGFRFDLIGLKHESGRLTRIQYHYFAGDYHPKGE